MKRSRRSVRLQGYDYSGDGAYFVTVCTHDRKCLFGDVADGKMRLNELGRVVFDCWSAIPIHFGHTVLDSFVVMPNHVHGIIFIDENRHGSGVGARHAVPLPSNPLPRLFESFGKPVCGSIPTTIRSFKSAVTKRINEMRNKPAYPIWQRNYYERIVRNETELNNVRQYIRDNPLKWETDPENPSALRDSLLPKLLSGRIRVKS